MQPEPPLHSSGLPKTKEFIRPRLVLVGMASCAGAFSFGICGFLLVSL